MKNIMKKALIFALVALIVKPAYPVFGVSAAGSTLSQWGMGALPSMYNGVKNHPWLTGTVVLLAAGVYLYKSFTHNLHKDYEATRIRRQKNNKKLANKAVEEAKQNKNVTPEELAEIETLAENYTGSNVPSEREKLGKIIKIA